MRLPDAWGGVAVLAALFAVQVLIGAAYYDIAGSFEFGDPGAGAVVGVLSNGIVLSFVMARAGLTYPRLFHDAPASAGATIAVLAVPVLLVVVGANWWFVDLAAALVPDVLVDPAESDAMLRLVGGGMVSVISVGLVGPVLEEMLFRGVLLRGFLQHYAPGRAIALSAVLFAAFHLTLAQIPTALAFGAFSGWLYWRTRSLWPCILAHTAYNLVIIARFGVPAPAGTVPYAWGAGDLAGDLAVDVAAFAVSAVGGYTLWRLLGPGSTGART